MFCQRYVHAWLLIVTLLGAAEATRAQPSNYPTAQATTTVRLRWGQQAGVSRYRLQLARDREFADIVFDRVVVGNEIAIDELLPGRYFWRIAPLTAKLGIFSSAAVIEAGPPATPPQKKLPEIAANPITASGGWHAAVGAISYPLVAHLRSPEAFVLVGTNSDGVTFALDAMSGVALWTVRAPSQQRAIQLPPVIIPSRSGRDNVLICAGTLALEIEGATGRELWRATLPASASAAAVMSDRGRAQIVIIDSSLQRLFILSELDGGLLSQVRLAARVFGSPVAVVASGAPELLIAYDTGAVEIRGLTGDVIRSGSTGSPPTTSPIFVHGPRGDLVLIGTRDGLTAMTADELQPLGRVALKDDAPRGILMSQDLDGDGVAEIIMTTARRHVVVVNATDGKIIWDAAADLTSGVAFGDINGDGVRDIFIAPSQAFAMALSGRDGSVLWKDVEQPALAANHAGTFQMRVLVAVPGASGLLLIGSEPTLTGLRAVAFAPTSIRPSQR